MDARRDTPKIRPFAILWQSFRALLPTLAFDVGNATRLLLVRESFFTGFIGLVLFVSPFMMKKPIFYYVMREFLTANEALPESHFAWLWLSSYFRRGTRIATFAWGALLLGDFVMRAFIALNMSVGFALGVAPILSTILMMMMGAATGFWLSSAISRALAVATRAGDMGGYDMPSAG